MKKSLLMLTALFIMGACQTAPTNSVSEPSIANAEEQLGDLTGMTRYHRNDESLGSSYKDMNSVNYYFNGTDKLYYAMAQNRTGEWSENGQIFSGENVVMNQNTTNYTTLVEQNDVKKYGENESNLNDIPAGWKVYQVAGYTSKKWNKDNNTWVERTNSSTSSFMIKFDGDKFIYVRLDNISGTSVKYANLFNDNADLNDLEKIRLNIYTKR